MSKAFLLCDDWVDLSYTVYGRGGGTPGVEGRCPSSLQKPLPTGWGNAHFVP